MALATRKPEVVREWDDGFVIRRMRQNEGQQVITWFSALAAMSCDLDVALSICEEDTDGFYVGELNGKMIASAVEVEVAVDIRYVGCVYVDEHHRRLGYAGRMMTTAGDIDNGLNSPTSIVALDTHPYLESMYEKFGYKTAYKSADYQGTILPPINQCRFGTEVNEVSDAIFDRLMTYDDKCFVRAGSAWRRKFMSRWLKIPGGRAMVAVSQEGGVVGYGCRRPSVNKAKHHHIGPLYADSYDVAWDLMHALTDDITGQTVQLTVLEPNEDAVRLVQEMKLHVSVPMIRMYRNGQHEALTDQLFAITSLDVCGF